MKKPSYNLKTTVTNGYPRVYVPGHVNATTNGYLGEHVFVMSQHIGRSLYPGEVVHHRDGNRFNNDIENLELFNSNSDHLTYHAKGVVTKTPYANKQYLKQRYVKDGLSAHDIARECNMSTSAIYYNLKKHKIKLRSPSEAGKNLYTTKEYVQKTSKITKDMIPDLVKDIRVMTLKELGVKYKCHWSTIPRRLRAWGVDYTPKHPEKINKKHKT